MIPIVQHPPLDRPGFCQTCYCENCSRGFYEKAGHAVKFSDGRVRCSAEGCNGSVRLAPLWQRQTPCKKCGYKGLVISKPTPVLLA